MHPAPQRFLACPTTLQIFRKAIAINGHLGYKKFSGTEAACNEGLIIEQDTQQEIQPLIRRYRSHVSPKASTKLLRTLDSESPVPEIYTRKSATGEIEQKKSWRSRLATFNQYVYESDFDDSFFKGERSLVDEEIHTENWEIWLELLRFQERHHGNEGARRVWRRLLQKDLRLPVEGPYAEELWTRILHSALGDELYMDEVLSYASLLQQGTGKAVPRVYMTIVASKLKRNASDCLAWHIRLIEHFPPQLRDYHELFKQVLTAPNLPSFEAIFKNYPVRPMYATIIPKLCGLGMYGLAYQWHFTLLKSGDTPNEFTSIEPLLTHYAHIEDDRAVEKITKSVIASGSQMEAPLNRFVRASKPISREIMNRRLGEVHGISPRRFSDQFCARLFATKFFRVETVISGLGMMAVESIGPQSLREIAFRDDCDCRAICCHFDLLKEAGIGLGSSKYETLIRQAALGNMRSLLRSIVECDAHPDTFEDLNLQEEMFTMHLGKADKVQMRRVLATITSEVPEETLEMQKMNILLRGYIRLNDKSKVLSLLAQMKVMNVPLTPKSSRHLRVLWLSPRRVARTGLIRLTQQSLSLIINVMKQTLESGGNVPITAWTEIVRRLGMTGQLDQCRSVALWLASWYASSPTPVDSGRILQGSFDRIAASKKSKIKASSIHDRRLPPPASLNMPEFPPEKDSRLSPNSAASSVTVASESCDHHNHLNQLFTKAGQQAMVAWGFQQDAKRQPPMVKHESSQLTAQPNWMWGLLLLRDLRERGVPVAKGTVSKACRIRLGQLFGTRTFSKRSVNRATRRRNERRIARGEPGAEYGAYVQQMEAIWGRDLFNDHPRTTSIGREWHGQWSRRNTWRIMRRR